MTKDEARQALRDALPAGTRVYTVLRHVSQSGMSRSISLVIPCENERTNHAGEKVKKLWIWELDYLVRTVLDYKIDQRWGGLKVAGGGTDMGFHLVNSLSYAIHGYGDSFDPGTTNLDVNGRDYRPGYTLDHAWL